jgi:hypothetical protein
MNEPVASPWSFISENALVSTLVAAALIGGIGWLWKYCRDRRDSERIYSYLTQSMSETDWKFRGTAAISSKLKIPESRVEELCHKHSKIRRNAKEKQSWTVES